MKILWFLNLGLCLLSSLSFGQTKTQDCTRLWQLEKEAGCPAAPPDSFVAPTPFRKDYFVEKKTFGPSKCVTGDDVDATVEALEDKCDHWTDKKQNELKENNRHITGVCNHECSPCPKNSILQKCTVKGEVQYKIEDRD
jgi:hypothetical protein